MSLNKKKAGFTLMEVLVSIVILGLVATASLRLSVLSMRNLKEVRLERDLLKRSKKLQLEIFTGDKAGNGEDKKISWDTRKYSHSIMGGLWRIEYRQLDVTSTKGNKITLYIP